MQYYNFHGSLPGYDNRKIGGENIDPDKAAFSMAPHDEEAYERVNMDDHDGPAGAYGDHHAGPSGGYGNGNPYSASDYDDPNRYGALPPRQNSTALFDSETEYNSGGGVGLGLGRVSPSPNPVTFDSGPAQFPTADYDRIHR